MDRKWLDDLVDPNSKEPLDIRTGESDNGRVVSGRLSTRDGQRTYPIIRGIPRFVPETLFGEQKSVRSEVVQTGRAFGYKWTHNTYSAYGEKAYERSMLAEQLFAMLGVDSLERFSDLFKDGMYCLDAGCGTAWGEYLFNVNPNVQRFGVDLSLSVEVAYDKTCDMDNVCIVQADIFGLPFKPHSFDIIFSNGVLHHTRDARSAFDLLCSYLKPGGLMGIYIYCVKPYLRELADEKIRAATTGMSDDECYEFSKAITSLGKELSKYKEPISIDQDIPLLNIKKGSYNLQRFIYDHFMKCYYNEELGFDMSVMNNVDWYKPSLATHHTREEIEEWFGTNGFTGVKVLQPKGWEHSGYFVSGRKTSD